MARRPMGEISPWLKIVYNSHFQIHQTSFRVHTHVDRRNQQKAENCRLFRSPQYFRYNPWSMPRAFIGNNNQVQIHQCTILDQRASWILRTFYPKLTSCDCFYRNLVATSLTRLWSKYVCNVSPQRRPYISKRRCSNRRWKWNFLQINNWLWFDAPRPLWCTFKVVTGEDFLVGVISRPSSSQESFIRNLLKTLR